MGTVLSSFFKSLSKSMTEQPAIFFISWDRLIMGQTSRTVMDESVRYKYVFSHIIPINTKISKGDFIVACSSSNIIDNNSLAYEVVAVCPDTADKLHHEVKVQRLTDDEMDYIFSAPISNDEFGEEMV